MVQGVWTHFDDCYRKGESGPSDIIEYMQQINPFFLSGMISETLKVVYPDVYKLAVRAEQEQKDVRRKQVESIKDRAIREAAHRSDDITEKEKEEGRRAGRYMVEMGQAEEFLTDLGLDKAQELLEAIDRKRRTVKSIEDTVVREGGNILNSLLVGVDNTIRRKAGMPLRKGSDPPQQRIEKTPATQLREIEQADRVRDDLLQKKREGLYPDGRWQHEGRWIQDVAAALRERADELLEEYQEYKRRLDDAIKK
jgi:hypothetical protein